jgi:hypothetical protein
MTITGKPMGEYPKRDITPEHTKRGSEGHGWDNDGPIHPEINAAYDYVRSVLDTSDYIERYAWHGWALREAFLAGISYTKNQDKTNLPIIIDSNNQSTLEI